MLSHVESPVTSYTTRRIRRMLDWVLKTCQMRQRKRTKSSADPAIAQQAEDTLAHVRVLWRHLFRNPFTEAREHGVTTPQVTVISCLLTRGPMTLTELSRILGMGHSTASGIVDRLESRGLLSRSRDAADNRRTTITVSDRVTRYVRELEAGPSGRLAAVLASATADQRRTIADGLQVLRELLEGSTQLARASARSGDSRVGARRSGLASPKRAKISK
jgi:MarR family transcriptional regulator, organic hydroperoxide resistance regulator